MSDNYNVFSWCLIVMRYHYYCEVDRRPFPVSSAFGRDQGTGCHLLFLTPNGFTVCVLRFLAGNIGVLLMSDNYNVFSWCIKVMKYPYSCEVDRRPFPVSSAVWQGSGNWLSLAFSDAWLTT